MEKILVCKCGCQVFLLNAVVAKCLNCGTEFCYILAEGYFPAEKPVVVVRLELDAMNTVEHVAG